MTDGNDWQQKYQEVVRELDEQTRQWQWLEETLRKVIGRLCIAGRGINTLLDQSLKEIQHLSRAKDDKALEKELKQLNEIISNLDNPNTDDQLVNPSPDPVMLLLELLREIQFDSHQREVLREITSRLLKLIASGIKQKELQPHISQLASLINENFHPPSDSSDNLLAREDIVNHLKRFDFEDDALDQICVDLENSDDPQTLATSINRVFIRIGEILAELKYKKGELETFIIQVKSQLTEITTAITAQQQDSETESSQTKALEKTINSGVDRITSEIKASSNLNELKQLIGENIETLKQGMKTYVQQANERREASDKRNLLLQKRISEMETQSLDLQKRIAQDREKMHSDPLTGILNRLAYDEELASSLLQWEKHQTSFIFAIADIDHFKRINDKYGHVAGDKALRVIAQMMQKQMRQSDYLFRVGGEEFVILLNGISLVDAETHIEKIRNSIEKAEVHFKQERVVLTLSAGMTQIITNDNAETLYERADKALYAAKEAGRNRQVIAA